MSFKIPKCQSWDHPYHLRIVMMRCHFRNDLSIVCTRILLLDQVLALIIHSQLNLQMKVLVLVPKVHAQSWDVRVIFVKNSNPGQDFYLAKLYDGISRGAA